MTPHEQINLYARFATLKQKGWDIRPDANRFRVYYPAHFQSRLKLSGDANIFVSSDSLEAAIVAAETADDVAHLVAGAFEFMAADAR